MADIRIRKLASALHVADDDVLLWLLEHAPEFEQLHPAAFLPGALAARVEQALRPLPAPPDLELDQANQAEAASINRREGASLAEAFADQGLSRLLVVGGAPATGLELREVLGEQIDLRIIDGKKHRCRTEASADLGWSDVAVIWGSTILAHKVAKLYMDQRAGYREKLVTVMQRGVSTFCRAVAAKVRGEARR